MIEVTHNENVMHVRMAHGKVNALDVELLDALDGAIADAASSGVAGLVLSGAGRAFSAGVDLIRMLDEGGAYVDRLLPKLSDTLLHLFTLPKPVVAAVSGHALAGGCILMAACDYRVAADGKAQFGVTELQVGVPFPAIAIEILRAAVANARFGEVVCCGRRYNVHEAVDLGLVHEIVGAEVVEEVAFDRAMELAAIPSSSFRITKKQIRAPYVSGFLERSPELDSRVAAIWKDARVHAAIRDYLDRTLGK